MTEKNYKNSDDWKDEYLPRLQQSLIYNVLALRCGESDNEVLGLVHEAVYYSVQRTKSILRHMEGYTLHDDVHLFRVLHIMEKLLTKGNIEKLSIPELMMLVLSVFFHDIGMAPDEKDVIAYKKVWDYEPSLEDDTEQHLFNEFARFYNARPDQQEAACRFVEGGKFTEFSNLQSNLITEFIRITHAERVRKILAEDWNERIMFRNTDLTVELANICQSHNEDALKLSDFDKSYPCGNGINICLPLIGVILRLADILDFDAKRTPSILYSHLYVRNPISVQEWQKHRAVANWEINSEIISFSAKCTHPAIEASIHEFCDLIDKELSLCNNIISELNEFYKASNKEIFIKIPYKVTRKKIQTKRDIYNQPLYTYRDTKFTLSKRQVIDLLMGTKLYGNPEVALRELLQNSIDACQLRQAQEKKWGNLYIPEITVKYVTENGEDVLTVSDNGTGMNQYIIDNYYSKVGSSFYVSTDFFDLKAETNADFNPRSRFGIGVLSCFMVADTLIVDTKKVNGPHKSDDSLNITVEGQESIFWIKPGQREVPGTTTKLLLRKNENPWERMGEEEFINSVESVIPNPPFKITIETSKEKRVRDENSFRDIKASSLKDYSWKEDDNIRNYDFVLDQQGAGFTGSVIVAILENRHLPTDLLELTAKDITIEEKTYTLEKKLGLSENAISQNSKTLTINGERKVIESNSSDYYAKSKSKISLHGIEIPKSLFPESWIRSKNQVKISWPFPLLLVVDINGHRDLELNSSRTEIIYSEKWTNFEEELARQICQQIANQVSLEYWITLKNILENKSKNETFLKGLSQVQKL